MGVAAPFLMIAGTAMSAVNQIRAGNAQGAASDYKAQVAANNAKIADENANLTIQTGNINAQNQSMKTAQLIGKEKVATAANGVDVNSGSAADVRSATAMLGRLDALTIRSNSAREAHGYKVQKSNFESEAQLDKMAAKDARVGGWMGAAGTVLQGASTVGKDYSMWQRSHPTSQNPASDYFFNFGDATS